MISADEKNAFVRLVGIKPAAAVMKTIEALRPLVETQESELGQQFLKEDVEEFSVLLNSVFDSLIADGMAKQEDVIKLRLLYGRIKRIAVRLEKYQQNVDKVKQCRK